MEFFFLLWNEVIIRPMLNTLMVLYVLCFNNMGIAIIVFTILVRLVTMPPDPQTDSPNAANESTATPDERNPGSA